MEKQELLILDDFGIQPLGQQTRTILLEIMEDRHGKESTILTSQRSLNKLDLSKEERKQILYFNAKKLLAF